MARVGAGQFPLPYVLEELTQSLEQRGFRVEYAQERTGFAPYGNDDPPVIRIAAVKPEEAV